MEKGLILIIVGLVLTITVFGAIIGLPLILVGAYLLNKKVGNPTDDIQKEIDKKQEELNNINSKLSKMESDKKEELNKLEKETKNKLNSLEQEKTNEINEKLKDKQEKLDNINETLDKMEKERIELIDTKLKSRKEELMGLDEKYDKLTLEKESSLQNIEKQYQKKINRAKEELKQLNREIIHSNEIIEFQEYGLYEPRYDFINAVKYKEELDKIRKKQKDMVKNKTAAICNTEWEMKGSKSKGKAFANANVKQILRSFNNETTVLINKVSHSNIQNVESRINKTFTSLNKLYSREDVEITKNYLKLKIDELHLAYEYEVQKQVEKEELREAREREREEKKLQKELEREKKKFNKENTKINDEIEEVKNQLTQASEIEKAKLEAEIAKLQKALEKNNNEIEKIDKYRETPGAGYVYIISNVGSFGEGVFKIGVTRRDKPEDRIRELSSASVPFRFDSHVFIFSDRAYDLESSLHERFDKQRVNKVNRRKEFFNITMDDVKQIVEENKGAVHSFVEFPDNEEYIDTLKIEKQLKLEN